VGLERGPAFSFLGRRLKGAFRGGVSRILEAGTGKRKNRNDTQWKRSKRGEEGRKKRSGLWEKEYCICSGGSGLEDIKRGGRKTPAEEKNYK